MTQHGAKECLYCAADLTPAELQRAKEIFEACSVPARECKKADFNPKDVEQDLKRLAGSLEQHLCLSLLYFVALCCVVSFFCLLYACCVSLIAFFFVVVLYAHSSVGQEDCAVLIGMSDQATRSALASCVSLLLFCLFFSRPNGFSYFFPISSTHTHSFTHNTQHTTRNAYMHKLQLMKEDSRMGRYKPKSFDLSQYMKLDRAAMRALNLFPSATDCSSFVLPSFLPLPVFSSCSSVALSFFLSVCLSVLYVGLTGFGGWFFRFIHCLFVCLFVCVTRGGGGVGRNAIANKNMSVYGLLNRTRTAMGARLLSQWIKQPLISVPLIGLSVCLSPPPFRLYCFTPLKHHLSSVVVGYHQSIYFSFVFRFHAFGSLDLTHSHTHNREEAESDRVADGRRTVQTVSACVFCLFVNFLRLILSFYFCPLSLSPRPSLHSSLSFFRSLHPIDCLIDWCALCCRRII